MDILLYSKGRMKTKCSATSRNLKDKNILDTEKNPGRVISRWSATSKRLLDLKSLVFHSLKHYLTHVIDFESLIK